MQLCTRIELLGSSTATALATCHRVQLLLQPCASKQQLECLLHIDTNPARNRSLPGYRRGHETKQQHEQKKREAQDCRQRSTQQDDEDKVIVMSSAFHPDQRCWVSGCSLQDGTDRDTEAEATDKEQEETVQEKQVGSNTGYYHSGYSSQLDMPA